MSECVVRMKMPSNCEKCPMCGTASGGNGVYKPWCMCGDIPASSWRRPKDCPIICQLQKGHGRLIEADEFLKRAIGTKYFPEDYSRMLEQLVRESFPIVPAERSET